VTLLVSETLLVSAEYKIKYKVATLQKKPKPFSFGYRAESISLCVLHLLFVNHYHGTHESMKPRAFFTRMLTNLKQIY
jgi:hypothetical protein